jgi:hypothetical protein
MSEYAREGEYLIGNPPASQGDIQSGVLFGFAKEFFLGAATVMDASTAPGVTALLVAITV